MTRRRVPEDKRERPRLHIPPPPPPPPKPKAPREPRRVVEIDL